MLQPNSGWLEIAKIEIIEASNKPDTTPAVGASLLSFSDIPESAIPDKVLKMLKGSTAQDLCRLSSLSNFIELVDLLSKERN